MCQWNYDRIFSLKYALQLLDFYAHNFTFFWFSYPDNSEQSISFHFWRIFDHMSLSFFAPIQFLEIFKYVNFCDILVFTRFSNKVLHNSLVYLPVLVQRNSKKYIFNYKYLLYFLIKKLHDGEKEMKYLRDFLTYNPQGNIKGFRYFGVRKLGIFCHFN